MRRSSRNLSSQNRDNHNWLHTQIRTIREVPDVRRRSRCPGVPLTVHRQWQWAQCRQSLTGPRKCLPILPPAQDLRHQSPDTIPKSRIKFAGPLWPKGVWDPGLSFVFLIPIAMTIRVLPGAFGLELCPPNRNQATPQIYKTSLVLDGCYKHFRLTAIYLFALVVAPKNDFAAAG